MFKNQFALGLKGMINKISSDNKSDNSLNNTPKNESERSGERSGERSSSVSSEQQMSSTHNINNNSNRNELQENSYLTDGQEVEGFLCPQCLRAFPSPESLSEHYSSEHSDFSNGFQCLECKMKFGSQQQLDSHETRHHSNALSTDEMIKREFSKISSVIESEELELLRGQINALEESKQLITNECKTLRQQLKRSHEEIRDIQNELSQLRCSNDENDSHILKKELVKVQKLMNDMSVEKEKEKELLTQEMKKQIENVVNERESIDKQLQDLIITHKQAINDLIDMRSKKEKLEVELNLLRNEGITVSSLRDDIQNKCSIIGKLEQNVEILTKQLETLKTQLIETQRERDDFKDEALMKKQLDTQIEEFKERAEKRTKENIELNVMVSQLKSQLESLSSQYESINIKMKVQEEMKTVGEHLDSKLAQEVQLLKIDLMTAKQNLETSTINSNKASEELNIVTNLNQTLKQENKQLIKNINSLNQEINSEKSESQNANKNLLKQINFLEDEIKLTRNELENCRIGEKQITSKYNEEKGQLKGQLQQINDVLILKEKQFENIVKENQKFESEVQKLKELILNFNTENLLLQNNLEKVEIENKNMEKKYNEIEQKLLFTENEKNLLNEELSNVSKALNDTQSQNDKYLAQKNEEISDLSKKVVDYDQKINENNNLSIKLSELEFKSNERLESLQSELNEKLKLIDSQHKNINDLNEKLNVCVSEIKLFQIEVDSLKNEKISFEQLLQNNELKFLKVNEDFKLKCNQLEKINNELISIKELLKNKDSLLLNTEKELQNVNKELESFKQLNDSTNCLLIERQTIVENQKHEINNLKEELKKTEKIKIDLSMQLNDKTQELQLKDAENVSNLQLLNGEIIKLRAGIEKEKSKQENFQTLNDQLLGVKLELEAKLSNINEEKRALIERCINSEEECEKLKTEVLQIRNKLDDSIAALHELGRENQSLQIQQTKLVNRKWTDDHTVINCTKCQKGFSVTNRKHHCRNCGQIFCNECSSKSAIMALHPKPVRVCDNCHHEMNKK